MIALIDNYDSFTHNLYQYLSQLTDEEIRVFRNDRISVNQLAKLEPSRIVISPGPGRPEGAGISVEAIRRFAGEVPILGVCLGHQAIAVAFGGRVVGAKEIVHGKTDRIAVDGRGVFRAINSPAEFARYHSLAVAEDDLPAELEVSARSPDGEIMGIRHVKHAIEGVQFHPESVASDEGMKLLGNFLSYRREPFEPRKYLTRIIDGASLTQHEASEFMEELTDGHLTDAQIAAFLVALNAKGIEATEVAGCAQVLQRKHTPLTVRGPLLDTCGTGGDGLGTHNISSLTALLAASCGARVAKHGNRAVSSRSGSADFYTALGINIETTPRQAAVSISDAGFAFLYAPLYHGAMRFAGPARRQLGIKTIMNLLGPLANPAGAEFQLIGVFSERHLRTVAEAAVRLGVRRGMVVHGLDGQDELSVCAPTRVISLRWLRVRSGRRVARMRGPVPLRRVAPPGSPLPPQGRVSLPGLALPRPTPARRVVAKARGLRRRRRPSTPPPLAISASPRRPLRSSWCSRKRTASPCTPPRRWLAVPLRRTRPSLCVFFRARTVLAPRELWSRPLRHFTTQSSSTPPLPSRYTVLSRPCRTASKPRSARLRRGGYADSGAGDCYQSNQHDSCRGQRRHRGGPEWFRRRRLRDGRHGKCEGRSGPCRLTSSNES
jgi:anthranilate synthase/phosphoribosyltransferase